MANNIYIHIPFCRQKCYYCSFISYTDLNLIPDYVSSLCTEIKELYKQEKAQTIYFGGGTPSLLEIKQFKRIINSFNYNDFTEITVEINPETVNRKYLTDLFKLGVNRISIGCQTFDNNILKIIGRKHSSQQVKDCIKFAKEAGLKNISLDFIYGLPSQTMQKFAEDLHTALNLGIQHISLYGLKIDEGCYFCKQTPENIPDNDSQADMYLKAIEIMTQNNFNHYEISNFALEGFESRHNLNYWNNNTYYGFGVAAHGYIDGIRYSNETDLIQYINNPINNKEEHILSAQDKLEEEIFLGFRRMQGIDINLINSKYNINFQTQYKSIIDKYLLSEHIIKTKNGYKLSDKGILVSNIILADFLQ